MDWIQIYRLILFLGMVQGVVFGVLLLRSKQQNNQNLANKILAIILFFFSYRLVVQLWHSQEIRAYESPLYHIFIEFNWVYGPLLFFYIAALLNPGLKFGRSYRLHLLPIIIEFVFSNFVKSQNFFWDGTQESLSWMGAQSYILWMHTPFQYLVATSLILYYALRSRKMVKAAREKTSGWRPTESSAKRINLLLSTYVVFSIAILLTCLTDYLFFNYAFNPFYIYPIYVGMALLTYWLGLQGLLNRNSPSLEKISAPVKDEQLRAIADQLEQFMKTQKPYLDPVLNVATLAEKTGIKSYLITKAINGILTKSFSDYVNEYRVREFTTLINRPDYENFTLLAIAFESGFNSKATYNRMVKKFTGKSPKELRKTT